MKQGRESEYAPAYWSIYIETFFKLTYVNVCYACLFCLHNAVNLIGCNVMSYKREVQLGIKTG